MINVHFILDQIQPPPKPLDHTYISVERVEADDKYASSHGYNINSKEFYLLI